MHDLPAHIKILSGLLFIIAAVATPISNWLAYLGFFALILTAIKLAQLLFKTVALRSLIEIPFVLFAFLMPFFGTGETIEVLGITLYENGILAGLGIIAKGTLGILTAILLSSTTTAREILRGLERLKVPTLIIQIATFMLRYTNVVNDEMERMRIARASRGFEATGVKHWKILGQSAGALFIRSYERGERVHLSMVSRGYQGLMPQIEAQSTTRQDLLLGFSLPVLATFLSITTRMIG
ncbi:MAG: cobalt ECF transporter T component CbiQ [Candidatus Nanopelagicaceae bacterium]|nr:cobalt ECF transporter T component CbiQ [Candidatus Nanopelagicaceae bacterium]